MLCHVSPRKIQALLDHSTAELFSGELNHLWTVPKYRSNSVYTSSYKRHRTVQYEDSTDTRSSIQQRAVSD